jgi:hypothetical protein
MNTPDSAALAPFFPTRKKTSKGTKLKKLFKNVLEIKK